MKLGQCHLYKKRSINMHFKDKSKFYDLQFRSQTFRKQHYIFITLKIIIIIYISMCSHFKYGYRGCILHFVSSRM